MATIGTFYGHSRIVIVDDDKDIRLYFKDVFQSEKSFTVAGEFPTGTQALAEIPGLQPNVALMDLTLPDMDGIECTRRLKRVLPSLGIVIVSGRSDVSLFDLSLDAGAVAYLIKPVDAHQLIATLRFAAAHAIRQNGISPAKPVNDKRRALNSREREVMGKLAEGLLYKEIADKLGMSYAAVHKCQHNIFRKLEVANRSEAARIWLQGGRD